MFSLFVLLFSSYKVWSDESVENEKLKRQVSNLEANPAGFLVKAYVRKVVFQHDDFLSLLSLRCEKSCELIDEAEKEIKKYIPKPESYDPTKETLRAFLSDFQRSSLTSVLDPSWFDKAGYVAALKNYIEMLKSYKTDSSECLEEFSRAVQGQLSNVFLISFGITNTGRMIDSDIDVNVYILNGSFNCTTLYIKKHIPKCLQLPKKPDSCSYFSPRTVEVVHPIHAPPDFSTSIPGAYYTNKSLGCDELSITLRDLKASESAALFRDDFYMKIESFEDLRFSILSVNANDRINSQVEVVFGEDVTWQLGDA